MLVLSWGMGFKSESKDYYESQTQTRVLTVPNLSMFLKELATQTLKLPHEITDPASNIPSGSTEEDIVKSIVRGVDMAYVMLVAQRKLLGLAGKPMDFDTGLVKDYDKMNVYGKAMAKLEFVYLLIDDADMGNERTISQDLPGEGYSQDEVLENDSAPSGTLPPSIEQAHAETLGSVGSKDKEPVS